jgi:cytochrome c553
MKKKIFYISSILAIVLFTACSDNKKTDEPKSIAKEATASGIEIVDNNHAKDIKVGLKDHNGTDNKYYFNYGVKSAYDQNAQPANDDASVRIRPRTAIQANMNIRSPYEKLRVSMITNTLSKKFIIKCSACHNDYANGVIGPSILGRDSDYIFNKIADFKSGKKSNPLMNDLIKMMDDKEIREIADEIYQFNLKLNKTRNK